MFFIHLLEEIDILHFVMLLIYLMIYMQL